jgi:hypothetical protein
MYLGGDPKRVRDDTAGLCRTASNRQKFNYQHFPTGTVVRASPKPLELKAFVRLAADVCNGWAQLDEMVHR